jgi:thioredoxin 1
MALELNQNNSEELLSQKTVTILQFSAQWCGPCRMLSPIIEQLSEDNQGKDVSVIKVNVDENQELAAKFGVRGIPTVVVLKDGEEKTRIVGLKEKSEYQSVIDGLL